MTSVYQRLTNKQLYDMINMLLELKVITEKQAEKFKWSVFKRHHDTHYDTKEHHKEANKTFALQNYYRKKFLSIWRNYWEGEIRKLNEEDD